MLGGSAPQHDERGFPHDDALEIFSPSPMLCGVKVRGVVLCVGGSGDIGVKRKINLEIYCVMRIFA